MRKSWITQSVRSTTSILPSKDSRPHQSTEIAILRAIPPPTLQKNYIAILDLKQAYPSVPKDKLLERCRAELTLNLCHQLGNMLNPTSFQTVGGDSEAVGTFNRGVPQGSVPRPSLYNLFMDSFPCSVLAEEPTSNDPVIMFAEDVQLQARSRDGLQAFLRQAATWAIANDITWKVAKCSIICADPNQGDPLTLAGEVMREVTQAEYLGVMRTVEGITHHHCLNRNCKANKRLNQLQSIGLNNAGFHPPTNRRTYITLVRSITEYQIHLTLWTNTLAIAYQ